MPTVGSDEIKIEAKIFCFDALYSCHRTLFLSPKKKDGGVSPAALIVDVAA
jgi:hypothetical protein